jgi:hypothetical protein
MAQEEVHCGVDLDIHLDENNHPPVLHENDKERTEKHHEEGGMRMRLKKKPELKDGFFFSMVEIVCKSGSIYRVFLLLF